MGQDPRSRCASGFTLVEVLISLVVLAILTGVAATRIDVTRMHMNSTVQMLSTTMVAAQREALTKQHDIILTFNTATRSVRMTWDVNNNSVIDNNERRRVVMLDSRAIFGRGGAPARALGVNPINFNRTIGGLPALIFHRNGSASGIGGFYITSARATSNPTKWSNDARAVEIVRATGRTEWYRYNGSAWIRGF